MTHLAACWTCYRLCAPPEVSSLLAAPTVGSFQRVCTWTLQEIGSSHCGCVPEVLWATTPLLEPAPQFTLPLALRQQSMTLGNVGSIHITSRTGNELYLNQTHRARWHRFTDSLQAERSYKLPQRSQSAQLKSIVLNHPKAKLYKQTTKRFS